MKPEYSINRTFLNPDLESSSEAPYYEVGVFDGFPSPGNDLFEQKISLDKEVFDTSPSTIYSAHVKG